ncbi:MAG: hypothetical protein JKY61_13025 [Planctomycetes bacterium]|nr:hypothetical protein [Planctomycetota bacterium]
MIHWLEKKPTVFTLQGTGLGIALRHNGVAWYLNMKGYDPVRMYGSGGSERYEALHLILERLESTVSAVEQALREDLPK